MNTPPRARSTRAAAVPPTPRHGARFDSPPPTSRKPTSSQSSSYSTATLSPPPSSPLGPDESVSFEQARRHRKRRAAVLDEPTEKPVEVESEGWKELEKMFGKDFGRKSTAVKPGFGLPTPSKTPAKKRKHLSVEAVGGSARRLFGSSSFAPAPAVAAATSTGKKGQFGSMPSKSRKSAGKLSLLAEDEDDGGSISIFTDNNARIPKLDPSPDNPFITKPGDAKKKRQEIKAKGITESNALGDEGRREDGMVYIFRGKKMFRKFADMDEADDPLPKNLPKQLPKPLPAFFSLEEEEVEEDEGDEGDWEEFESDEEEFDEEEDEEINALLNNRSTIRPRLLFPSKEVEEKESSETEEEAETDVEEEALAEEITVVSTKKIDRSAISRLTPDSDDDFQSDRSGRRVKFQDVDDIFGPGTIPKTPRKKSIFDVKKSIFDVEESSIFDVGESSIFDEELPAKSTEEAGIPKERRKRARGGSFDAPGLYTPRKEKKTRGTMA